MSIEFESPANRIISQFAPKNQFRINPSLSGEALFRQLSIQGRLRYDTASNTTLTITPTVGETYFLYRLILSDASGTSTIFTLSNDGMDRLTVQLFTAPMTIDVFDSLVGDSSKSITVTESNVGTITALGWVENTSRIRDPTV